jgi:pimeloyl-ACP methyl ester carboxylesterase
VTWLTTADGTRLRYADRGGGPTAFVLVHGWKQSHRLWDRCVPRLSERHRVVAYDHRGMGESDKPDSRYDFDELAGDLGHVLEALDLDDVVLVGWSMGCTVVLRHMELGGARTRAVVLLNGPLRLTRAPDFPHTMTQEQLDGYLSDVADAWPVAERAFQAEGLRDPLPELVDWLWQVAVQTPLDVALRVVREQARLDLREVVATLTVPVLAAYGRHDPYYPVTLGQWIAEAAPDGRAIVFDHSAHCPPIEESVAFCAALEDFAARTTTNVREDS